jgi:WD40 repeat protein
MDRLTGVLVLGFVAAGLLPGQSDLFEWSLSASIEAGQRVTAIAFSPDGSKGAIATASGTVQIFDPALRPPSLHLITQQKGRVVALHFTSDGSALMSAGEDGNVVISSLGGDGDRTVRAKGKLLSAALSRDGTLLATSAEDKSVIVWDIQSSRQIGQLQHKSNKPFVALGFGEKDLLLVGVSESGAICEWDVKTRALVRQMQDSEKTVHSASVGDSGNLLAIGTEFADFHKGPLDGLRGANPHDIYRENRIKVYDLNAGKVVKTFDGINGDIKSLALSADNRFVGFVRQVLKDSFLEVYDAQRGVEVASSHLPDTGTTVSFSHQGKWLGAATDRGDVMMWGVKGILIPVTPTDLGPGSRFTLMNPNSEPLVAPASPVVVAVMDFDANGSTEPGTTRAVADMVRTQIGEGKNVRIVERAGMEKIMKEQNFSVLDRVDPATAIRLGRLLGAGKMVFGSVSRLDTQYVISVRMVDVETGVIDGERAVSCKPCGASDLQEAIIVLKPVLVK